MGLWDSFKANLGDSVRANLRTGGNGPAARQEFRQLRAERKRREAAEVNAQQLIAVATLKWLETANEGQGQTQYVDDDVRVEVKSGWSRDRQCDTTEIIVSPRVKGSGRHLHIVFDDCGEVIYEQWNDPH